MRKRVTTTHPAIQHLNDLEAEKKRGQLQVWRDAGVTETEIATVAPAVLAQLSAVFDAWRDEVRARLGISLGPNRTR